MDENAEKSDEIFDEKSYKKWKKVYQLGGLPLTGRTSN